MFGFRSKKEKKKYYTNDVDMSEVLANFQKSNNSLSLTSSDYNQKFKIIGGKIPNTLTETIIRYIVPDYLIQAYETTKTLEILKSLNVERYLQRIIKTKYYSLFQQDDKIRENSNLEILFYDNIEQTNYFIDEVNKTSNNRNSIESTNSSKSINSFKLSLSEKRKKTISLITHENETDNENDNYFNLKENLIEKKNSFSDRLNDWEPLNNFKFIFSKKTLTILTVKEIPKEYRPNFWYILSGAKHEKEQYPNYYDFLVNNYKVPLPFERQIDLDLHRTFPEDPYFKDEKNIKRLKNILLAYSRRNVSIGYVQGFNFIVGKLLKVVEDEEKVFFIFLSILENKMPINFYSEMCGLMADVDIMIKILDVFCPKIIEHFLEYELLDFLKNFLLQWFLSIFTHQFNDEFSHFIFDIFFVQGSIVLFKIAYYIIKESEEKLLLVTNFNELKSILDKSSDYSFNYDNFKEFKFKLLEDFIIDEKILAYNRLNISNFIELNIRKFNNLKINSRKDEIKKINLKETFKDELICDLDWPICIYDIDAFYNIYDFLIFHTEDSMNLQSLIINDYFTTNNKFKSKFSKDSSSVVSHIEKLDTDISSNSDSRKYIEKKKEKNNNLSKENSEINDFYKPQFEISFKNKDKLKVLDNKDILINTPEKQKRNKIDSNKTNNCTDADEIESNDINVDLNANLINSNENLNKLQTFNSGVLTMKNSNICHKSKSLKFEEALLERRQHTCLCIELNKEYKQLEITRRLDGKKKTKGKEKLYESVSMVFRNKIDSKDMKSKYHEGRNEKSASLVFDYSFNKYEENNDSDFNNFIQNLKNRYNKFTYIKDSVCIDLIEKNRAKRSIGKK